MSEKIEDLALGEAIIDDITRAEEWLDALEGVQPEPDYDQTIALAQARATVALAEATAASALELRKLRLLIDHSMNVAGVEGEFLEWLDRAKGFEDRVNDLERENMALRSEMEKKR